MTVARALFTCCTVLVLVSYGNGGRTYSRSSHKRGQNILVSVVDQILCVAVIMYGRIGRHIAGGGIFLSFFNCMWLWGDEVRRADAAVGS